MIRCTQHTLSHASCCCQGQYNAEHYLLPVQLAVVWFLYGLIKQSVVLNIFNFSLNMLCYNFKPMKCIFITHLRFVYIH